MYGLDSENPAHQREKGEWRRMSPEEEDLIHRLHHLLGDRWDLIANRLPNRRAEEVERYWIMTKKKKFKDNNLFKPVCARLSPSFKFVMAEPSEKSKPK